MEEDHVFCSIHEYADDLYNLARLLGFPGVEINTCRIVDPGQRVWYEYLWTLPNPFYRVGHAVPRVMQTYLALVAYVEEHEVPAVTEPLRDFYTKYVYQKRHLHVVTKKMPARLTEIPF
jgi:hypothetical protein